MVTDFGKFCRKLRIDNDETMKDMARKLGVTDSYLSAVERGKRSVPTDWSEKLANEYRLSESQVRELTNMLVVSSLTEKEKAALNHAVSAIYFADTSDYLTGLYSVVNEIVGSSLVSNDGFSPRDLFDLLNPEG